MHAPASVAAKSIFQHQAPVGKRRTLTAVNRTWNLRAFFAGVGLLCLAKGIDHERFSENSRGNTQTRSRTQTIQAKMRKRMIDTNF
jgi:hypothetical protein